MIKDLVLINNFIHDLSAAMWFCGLILLFILEKEAGRWRDRIEIQPFVRRVFKRFSRITIVSLVVVLAGGIIRAINFKEYEWLKAAGDRQIHLLIIKHIFLLTIVILGIYLHLRLSRKISRISS